MAGIKAKSSKKNRKFGRNKIFCAKYIQEMRILHNKIKRLKRHLKKYPLDNVARKVLDSFDIEKQKEQTRKRFAIPFS